MDGAAGSVLDCNLLYKIMELFPDACPNYLRQVCSGKEFSEETINAAIEEILTTPNYPKRQLHPPSPVRELNREEQRVLIKSILPDVDPEFMDVMTSRYRRTTTKLRTHLVELLDSQDYPRKKNDAPKKPSEGSNRRQILAQQHQYTDKFSVENFLKLFPDPDAHFNDPERMPSITDIVKDHSSYLYAMHSLYNLYNVLPQRTISLEFRANNYRVVETAAALEKLAKRSKANSHGGAVRRTTMYYKRIENIPLLQEIAYVNHRNEIRAFIKKRKRDLETKRDRARRDGLMKTCRCCFDEEVMPDEEARCQNKCTFCKSCLRKDVEIGFAEGKTDFACLDDCESHFSLETVQEAVSPRLFSKLLQKMQLDEVQSAGIEGLATCPFCSFSVIMDPNYTILHCLNTECMKETCRLCKGMSHIPLRCDEVERDDDIKARVYMESKLTEALLRSCYKCGLNFIKSVDGCNKITCSCGAKMCYICKVPVEDYSHFNGPGGDDFEKCPLFSDTHELHENNILQQAEKAKAEIKKKFGKGGLKRDPTLEIEQHYGKLRRENPPRFLANI